MTPRIGFPFCCLSRRLPIPRLLLAWVTCWAVAIGALLPPGLEGNAKLWHLFSNKSNQQPGSCEAEARLAASLDFWTLSSENLLGMWWQS